MFLSDTKEPHFFNSRDTNLQPVRAFDELGLDWYRRFFRRHESQRAVGEATPLYLCDLDAPSRIARTLPDVRLVCSLRDPVTRAHSHYWMAHRKGNVDEPLLALVERDDERIIRRGDYAEQLERYFALFGPERVLVLVHEELFDDPQRTLRAVARHIGAAEEDTPRVHAGREFGASRYRSQLLLRVTAGGAKRMRRHRGLDNMLDVAKRVGLAARVKDFNRIEAVNPALDAETRQALTERYRESVARLTRLLGRPLPWTTEVDHS